MLGSLDENLVDRYLTAKSANPDLTEYQWRQAHGENTITMSGTFSPLTDWDAVRASSASGSGHTSALANPSVAQMIATNNKLSTSAMINKLSAEPVTNKAITVSDNTILVPSAVNEIIRNSDKIAAMNAISNVSKVNSTLPVSAQLKNQSDVQKIEKALNINKAATNNTSVKQIMSENSKLTTSQLINKIDKQESVEVQAQKQVENIKTSDTAIKTFNDYKGVLTKQGDVVQQIQGKGVGDYGQSIILDTTVKDLTTGKTTPFSMNAAVSQAETNKLTNYLYMTGGSEAFNRMQQSNQKLAEVAQQARALTTDQKTAETINNEFTNL